MLSRNLPLGVQEVEHGRFPSVRPRDSSWNRNPSQIPRLILAEKRRNSFYTYRLFLSGDSDFAARIEGIKYSFARRRRRIPTLAFSPAFRTVEKQPIISKILLLSRLSDGQKDQCSTWNEESNHIFEKFQKFIEGRNVGHSDGYPP
jgi:hypothetical protein